MKILAFTDIHADPEAFATLKRKIKNDHPEIVACCGDISNFGMDLEFAVKQILSFKKKTLLIPGNHETAEEVRHISQRHKEIINLHDSFFEIDNVVFYGYGGGGFSLHDPKFEKKIQQLLKKIPQGKKLVFLTHAPIYNTKLDKLSRGHFGNKSTRTFIELAKPTLALCGHFHENEKKKDVLGNSHILNPGCDGMIIEI
ncbi:MAG TPA: metallophosphoesterase [Candidatus Nanoarchaeia archaeon]|nr:metallophosphoesterase [Candidatus Nanoarchaeia archaeon]